MLNRLLVTLAVLLLASCGGGGGSSSSGGGGTASPFALADRAGLWLGQAQAVGQPGFPLALQFDGAGVFLDAGEAWRNYPQRGNDSFTDEGQLTLAVRTADKRFEFHVDGRMNQARNRITGTWKRFDQGALVAQGSFELDLTLSLGKRALAGSWSGEFLSFLDGSSRAAALAVDGAGNPSTFLLGTEEYLGAFDLMTVSVAQQVVEISIESSALLRRYELTGTLDVQRAVFVGSWRYFDLWQGSGVLEDGSFELRLDLEAFPRTLAELAGTWEGTAFHPAQGTTDFTIEFDAQGEVTGGVFGEFGNPEVDFVSGAATLESAPLGVYSADVEDQFSQLGADVIRFDGVLSAVSPLWTGQLDHYFWGPCTFTLQQK